MLKALSLKKLSLLVFVAGVLFYVPLLGSYGLFDPWETHYSEVGRSMLQRDDYISTFWQDNGFYSKPVLTFWLQAAGMRAAGLNRGNDKPGEMALSSAPEWAVRVPVVLLAALAIAMLFWIIARFFGRAAGGLSALLLLTTPHFALVARQTITDMPFVALITCAMAFFTMGVLYDPKGDQHPYMRQGASFFRSRDPLFFITAGVLVLLVIPQYLLFAASVPASFVAFNRRIELSGFLVFLPYLLLLADALVSIYRDPRGKGKLYILLGFAFVGLGILAKGFGALFIPAVVFFLYFALTGEWNKLWRFDLVRGLLVLIAVAFPWHHAMIVRHGGDFFQEYFVHHHFKRAALGVHGERGVFTYYINQMLFGLFTLLPLLPGLFTSLAGVSLKRPRTDRERATIILLLWALVSFFLFSFMLTKFHHYILPASVPLAALCGIYLARFSSAPPAKRDWIPLAGGVVLLLFAARELFLDPAHMVNLFIYKYERLFPYEAGFGPWLAGLSGLLVVATALFVLRPQRLRWIYPAATVLFTGYLIYVYIPKVAPHWSQKALHRIYFTCREGPQERFIAWQLNWRGENFYSKNQVLPYMDTKNKEFFAHLERYRTHTKGPLLGRFLILESQKRYEKLKDHLNKRLYDKYPQVYGGKRANDLVKIIGPGCREIPEEWETHYRQRNYKVLKTPYPHNKFMLVRIRI